jgi:hypothetical protein
MLNDVIECPICLNEINNDEGIIIPECCNNVVHLKCIMNWYGKNNTTNVCFICQQVNNFSKNIHLNPPEKEIEIRENLLAETNNIDENKKCIKLWLYGTLLATISSIIIFVICL